MTELTLGFKAFDAHELLCHFVAVEAGLYRKHRLQVALADITFVAETDLPRHWFQVSCGAALASAVKGIPQRVVLVATDKPMFWIYSSAETGSLAELGGKRLATFPAVAPPHHLANIILSRAGLAGSAAVRLHAARDDTARLGLLRSGNVEAAVISSAIAPARLTALGYHSLSFFGDEIRIPTTGLAIDQSHLEQEPDLTRLLVRIHRKSLVLIHEDTKLVGRVLRKIFDVAPEHADATAMLFQNCYTINGGTTPNIAQSAIDALSKPLNIDAPLAWREIYRF